MSVYFIELLNIAAIHAACLIVLLCPMWETWNVNVKLVCVYITCLAAAMCVVLLIARQFMTIDLDAVRSIRLYFALPVFVFPFIVFRKQMWNTAIVTAMGFLCYTLISVMSLFVLGKSQTDNPLQYAGIADVVIGICMLPTILIALRHISTVPGVDEAPVLWRVTLLVPALFSVAVAVFGSYMLRNNLDGGIILLFIAAYGGSNLIIYIFYLLIRSASVEKVPETEELRRKAGRYRTIGKQN